MMRLPVGVIQIVIESSRIRQPLTIIQLLRDALKQIRNIGWTAKARQKRFHPCTRFAGRFGDGSQ